jgi:hypothetical protein
MNLCAYFEALHGFALGGTGYASRQGLIGLLILLSMVACNLLAEDVVTVYPPLPGNLYQSQRYEVTVRQAGVDHSSYVYTSTNTYSPPWNGERERKFMTDSNHWTSFSFSGPIDVLIRLPQRKEISQAKVLPGAKNIVTKISGNTISIHMDKPASVYLKIDGEEKHPLFIFANPPEKDVPAPNTPNLIYFGPGVHDIGTRYSEIGPETTIYIAGGAFVKGRLRTAENAGLLRIRGRGILSGIDYPMLLEWGTMMIWGRGVSPVDIEGITVTDAPGYNITAMKGKSTIDNVKLLSWHMRNDGIDVGEDSLVTHCFLKVNNDALKPYASRSKYLDNIVWQQAIGSPVQLSWNLTRNVTGVVVSGLDIIHVDRSVDPNINDTKRNEAAIFGMWNLDGANYSDILIENVRIEDTPFRLFLFQTRKAWQKDSKGNLKSKGEGTLEQVTFRNISCPQEPLNKSIFDGNGENTGYIRNITFDNVTIGGTRLTAKNADRYIDRQNKTENFNYK